MPHYRKRLGKIALTCLIFYPASVAFSCTTIMVKLYDQNGRIINTYNARNMDFEQQIFFNFGFGAVGDKNISDVNFYPDLPDSKVASWTNAHKFIGRMSINREVVIDGINDGGVWAGALFLPNFTKYPVYNRLDSRPALSVMDTLNYVLGVSNSVQDAIAKLGQVQLVNSASQTTIGNETKFINEPLHIVIRDKSGDAAVVESIDGKVQITSGQDIDAVTNGPSYRWQIQNFNKISPKFVKYNTTKKWEGQYMNGSGLYGLGASYVSPDRFVQTKQLLKFSPKATTPDEAFTVAEGVIDKLKGTFGQTPAPTLWQSVADLANNIYFFKPFVSLGVSGHNGMKAVLSKHNDSLGDYVKIDLNHFPNSVSEQNYIRVQTTRDVKYVNPTSSDVSYSKGVLAGACYNAEFISQSQFTPELIKRYLFEKSSDGSKACK